MNGTTRLLMMARDAMAARGHAKHELEDDAGRVCLVGAIDIAMCGDALRMADADHRYWWLSDEDCRAAMTRLLESVFGKVPLDRNAVGALVDWNNAPERTQEEVLDAFDKAIKRSEEA